MLEVFCYLTSDILQIVFLDILEVLVGSNLQLVGGGLVSNDDAVLMHLQGRNRPLMCYCTLYSSLQSACFVVTIDENHYFFGIHDSTYADRQRQLGNLVDVVVEETTVGNDGVG